MRMSKIFDVINSSTRTVVVQVSELGEREETFTILPGVNREVMVSSWKAEEALREEGLTLIFRGYQISW